MMSGAKPGLTHPRVQAEIAHELTRALEPADVADRRHDAGRHRQIDAGDRHQPFHGAVVQRALGDLAVENGKVLGEPVEFAQMPDDRLSLVIGQRLTLEPLPSQPIEELGVRALRNEVSVQDRMDLVLDPGAMANDLIAARRRPALALGLRIGVHISGKYPAANRLASVPASILSVFTWAWRSPSPAADWRSRPSARMAREPATPPSRCRSLQ